MSLGTLRREGPSKGPREFPIRSYISELVSGEEIFFHCLFFYLPHMNNVGVDAIWALGSHRQGNVVLLCVVK